MYGIFFEDLNKNCIGHIMAEIFKERVYEPYMKKDITIIEVGGNVGIVTLYFSQFAKHIYVLEPSEFHLNCLRKTVEFNNLTNVTIIPKALDAIDGEKPFYHCDSNTTMFTLNPAWETQTTEQVECVSMTTLFETYGIETVDFMKLDVEGSEIDIIGSAAFKEQCSKIKSMVVENHAWSGYPPRTMENLLTRLGYKWKRLQSDAPLYYAEQFDYNSKISSLFPGTYQP
jgi:FkbM family methyltransferase